MQDLQEISERLGALLLCTETTSTFSLSWEYFAGIGAAVVTVLWAVVRPDLTKYLRSRWADFGKPRVLVDGLPNVGKSTLISHLEGVPPGFIFPSESRIVETTTIDLSDKPERKQLDATFFVLPGQNQQERSEGLEKLALQGVDGVIFVVDFGYNLPRTEMDRERARAQTPSLIERRQLQFKAEKERFDATCSFIMSASARGRRKPKWLLIVAAKYDLYASSMFDVHARYNPDHGTSDFAAAVTNLINKLGANSLDSAFLTVSACSEEFCWNMEPVISPQLSGKEQHELIAELRSELRGRFDQG